MKKQNIFSCILSTKLPWYFYLVGFIIFVFVLTLIRHFLSVTLGVIPIILLYVLVTISLKAIIYFFSSPAPDIPPVQSPTPSNSNSTYNTTPPSSPQPPQPLQPPRPPQPQAAPYAPSQNPETEYPSEMNRFSQVLQVLKTNENDPDPIDLLFAQIVADVHYDADSDEDRDFLSNTIVSASDAILFTAFLQHLLITSTISITTMSNRRNKARFDRFDLKFFAKISIILHQYEHLPEADTNSLMENRLSLYTKTGTSALLKPDGNIIEPLVQEFSNILLIDSIYGGFIPYSSGAPLPESDPLDRFDISVQVADYISDSLESLEDFVADVKKYYFS